jgi:hypothetical protein
MNTNSNKVKQTFRVLMSIVVETERYEPRLSATKVRQLLQRLRSTPVVKVSVIDCDEKPTKEN